jgi:hypothetical protein
MVIINYDHILYYGHIRNYFPTIQIVYTFKAAIMCSFIDRYYRLSGRMRNVCCFSECCTHLQPENFKVNASLWNPPVIKKSSW